MRYSVFIYYSIQRFFTIFAVLKIRVIAQFFGVDVAQRPEQLICNQLAGGSNPSTGSRNQPIARLELSGGTPELESRGRL